MIGFDRNQTSTSLFNLISCRRNIYVVVGNGFISNRKTIFYLALIQI